MLCCKRLRMKFGCLNFRPVKNLSILFLMCVSVGTTTAQTVSVTLQNQRVDGKAAVGYGTTLEAPKEEVSAFLFRYLKTFGKPKTQNDLYIVSETSLVGQVYDKPMYAQTTGNHKTAIAWMGVDPEEWGSDSLKVTSQLEGFVKTLGINFYQEKIQKQVEEAQQAVQAVERQQQRLTTEKKNLNTRLDNSILERQQLLKALESNKQDSTAIRTRLYQNQTEQDSPVIVLEKVKKAVEFQKERQRKVKTQ